MELAGSKNREVIRNLKIYFTQELLVNVEAEVAANLKGRNLKMVEEAHRCIEVSVQLGKAAPYLYYISFSDKSFKVCYVVHWGRSWPIIIIITTSLDKLFPPFLSTYGLLMSIFRAFLNPLLLLPTELPILRNHWSFPELLQAQNVTDVGLTPDSLAYIMTQQQFLMRQ